MKETLSDLSSLDIYPGVSVRVKALFSDTVVMMVLMLLFSTLFSQFESVADEARILAIVFIFLLYDPLLTSFTGATLGHRLLGLRVRRANDFTKNVIFPLVFIRFLLKAALAWISLLTVQSNPQRKAVHDLLVGSVVVELG